MGHVTYGIGKQVTAVAPTSKRHCAKCDIITWPCNLRDDQDVKSQGQGLTSLRSSDCVVR